jgi:hypothetical protein
MLIASIPRNLRVRSSIQLSSTRVPARAFLIVAGLIFLGGMLVVGGAELMRTVKLIGALIVLALIVFEMRWWGRSTHEVAQMLRRHVMRPRRLRLSPVTIVLPPESSVTLAVRRARWQELS